MRARTSRGFTLIEVLVALTIVAVGMAAVLSALSSSADTIVYLRDKTFAQWIALNRIATVRVSGQQPPTGNSNGDTDYAGRKWHWRQEVVATEVPGAVRIDVKVRPAEVTTGEDSGWVSTVSGIYGNAVGVSDTVTPKWGFQQLTPVQAPGGAGSGNPPTTPTVPTPLPGNPKSGGTE